MKIPRKANLIFEGAKVKRSTSFKAYTKGIFEITGIITKPGLHLSKNLNKLIHFPKNKTNKPIELLVTIFCKNSNSKFSSLEMIIYNNNYGVYLKPVNKNDLGFFNELSQVSCLFKLENEHLTDYYQQLSNFVKKTKFKLNNKNVAILEGGSGLTTFKIYRNRNQIYILHKGIIDTYGRFLLSSELRRYLKDWFNDELFLINFNNRNMVVQSKVHKRIKSKKITKVIQFQHHGQPQNVEILLTNSTLRLNNRTVRDLEIKEQLNKFGFKIDCFNTDYRYNEEHKNISFERKTKDVFQKCFPNSTILYEVRIKPKLTNEKILFQNYFCVDIVVPFYNSKTGKLDLILVEIKTGDSEEKKLVNTEYDIARLTYLKEQLGEHNIIPLVIFDSDIRNGNKITTKQYGLFTNTILIGKSEFQEIIKYPIKLNERINEYKDLPKISYDLKNSSDIEILGQRKSKHKGSEFEKFVADILRNQNYQVASNVLINCHGKDIEVDHIAMKNEKQLLISCKDRTNWKSSSIEEELKKYLIRLYFRKTILGVNTGKLFVKTANDIIIKTV